MAFASSRLRKIEKDWLAMFPGYASKGKPGDINKRIGPLMISMSTLRGGRGADDYLPSFSVHNLASPSEFLFISLKQELPYPYKYIKEKEHEDIFKERIEMMKTIAPIPLLGPITLEDIFNGYSRYMETAEEYNKHFISHLEGPPLIAAWCGELEKAREYLRWADNIWQSWGAKNEIWRKNRFGFEGDQWLLGMKKRIADPEKLRQICREEVIKHKCEEVPYQNIVGVKYQTPI